MAAGCGELAASEAGAHLEHRGVGSSFEQRNCAPRVPPRSRPVKRAAIAVCVATVDIVRFRRQRRPQGGDLVAGGAGREWRGP